MQGVPTEPSACPVCGPSAKATLSFNATDRLHGIAGTFSYYRCSDCGLLYQNPRVRPDSSMDVYPKDYMGHIPLAAPTGIRRLGRLTTRWLRGATLPRHIVATLGPASRVLDVGCGAGEFLNEVRTRFGCRVEGLDLSEGSKQAASATFGIDVFCGPLDAAPWAPASFDLITAWWSLEHMADPEPALARMCTLLAPGGHMLIAIPNSQSLVARVFGSRWYHLDCPRHYHLWTPRSIRQLLERQGLTYRSTRFDKSPWGLLGSLQYAIYGDNIRAEVANRLRGNTKLAPAFLPLTFALGMLGYSDMMAVTATKP
jgi:SAM-dependent methyltransferase